MPKKFEIILLVLLLSSASGMADVLWLTPEGVTQLKGMAKRNADGKYFVRGQVIVHRDSFDHLTLKYPRKYFIFKPAGGSEMQMEWNWVLRRPGFFTPQVDTMEDIRAIVSNRDQRYGSLQAGFNQLLIEVDPENHLHLKEKVKGDPPVVRNSSISVREGSFSRLILRGPIAAVNETRAIDKAILEKPLEDPEGAYLNPFSQIMPEDTMIGSLIETIARAEKYGEPEKGVLEASREVAKFISETCVPTVETVTGPEGEKASWIRDAVEDARRAVLGCYLADGQISQPEQLTSPIHSNYAVDDAPVDAIDMAKASLEIIAAFRTPYQKEGWGTRAVVQNLTTTAAIRSDLFPEAMKLPPALRSRTDAVTKQAMQTLVLLASWDAQDPNRGIEYRSYILPVILDNRPVAESPSYNLAIGRAAAEALLTCGIGRMKEASTIIDGFLLTAVSMHARENPEGLRWLVSILKRFLGAKMPADVKAAAQRYLADQIQDLRKRYDAGNLTPDEVAVLNALGN